MGYTSGWVLLKMGYTLTYNGAKSKWNKLFAIFAHSYHTIVSSL